MSSMAAPMTTPGSRESDSEGDDEGALGGHKLFLPVYACFSSFWSFPLTPLSASIPHFLQSKGNGLKFLRPAPTAILTRQDSRDHSSHSSPPHSSPPVTMGRRNPPTPRARRQSDVNFTIPPPSRTRHSAGTMIIGLHRRIALA